jgi:hypothetical protein
MIKAEPNLHGLTMSCTQWKDERSCDSASKLDPKTHHTIQCEWDKSNHTCRESLNKVMRALMSMAGKDPRSSIVPSLNFDYKPYVPYVVNLQPHEAPTDEQENAEEANFYLYRISKNPMFFQTRNAEKIYQVLQTFARANDYEYMLHVHNNISRLQALWKGQKSRQKNDSFLPLEAALLQRAVQRSGTQSMVTVHRPASPAASASNGADVDSRAAKSRLHVARPPLDGSPVRARNEKGKE